MRINSRGGTQEAALDDADSGEGLAIFFSQGGESVARYRFQVRAVIDEGFAYDVGEFYSSPPTASDPPGRLSRMIAGAVCPGAIGWRVSITPIAETGEELPEETANVVLASSKCCTSPLGVSRVSERYAYVADEALARTDSIVITPGKTVTGIAAIGLTGGGTITINGGDAIIVPEGISANPEPMSPLPPNSVIEFDNVDYILEYLESA